MMNIHNVYLEKLAVSEENYPSSGMPEIAFLGRSNVGKSSLINNLLARKSLARTSGSPGKTRTINFYNVDETFYLVDLPGYGYAKTSKSDRKAFRKMMFDYIYERQTLAMAVLLVDSRHKPSKLDIDMFASLVRAELIPLVVATKVDKLKANERVKNIKRIKETLRSPYELKIIEYSATKNIGRDKLLSEITDYITAITESE